MKGNMELERKDLVIDRDMEVDCDIGQQITCYIETWFDTDEKFRIHTDGEEGTWLNMYGRYNPFADTLLVECVISGDDFSDAFDYQPTAAETQLIKDMITEKIREVHGQTPKEFCDSYCRLEEEKVYVYSNRGTLSAEQIVEKHDSLNDYCENCGYVNDGSISISATMSRCGSEFQNMIDYCRNRGINKILVYSFADLGDTMDDVIKVAGILCDQGFMVEAADCGQTITAIENKAPTEEDEDQGFTMGGM